MKTLSRILDDPWYYPLCGLLIGTGHMFLAVAAIQGSEFAIYCLIGLLFAWTGIAILHGYGHRRTNANWKVTLDYWGETNKYVQDQTSLMREALDALSTWDREVAQDIASRWDTITKMRHQNMAERRNA